ncbi:hypothetical protein ABPG74_022184 [Tetrahymena malaccensis]
MEFIGPLNDRQEKSQGGEAQKSKFKKRIIKKQIKIRKEMCLFKSKDCENSSLICKYIMANYFNINRSMVTPKKFLMAGGILVELANYSNQDSENEVNQYIRMQSTLKQADGSILINLQMNEVQFDFERVVKILQSTQNKEDYLTSLYLQQVQNPLLCFREQITYIQNFYNPTLLQQIIYQRKLYQQAIQKQLTNKYLGIEDIGLSISYAINWDLKSLGNCQQSIITSSLIALQGVSADELISYAIRNNANQLLTQDSRKRIFSKTVEFFEQQLKKKNMQYTFDDLEIKLVDDIIIICQCQLFIDIIQYPNQLQIQNYDILNSSDCVAVFKFNLTHEHLERVIKIRNQQLNQNISQKHKSGLEMNEINFKNFEYYLQTEIFIEKFYKNQAKTTE